MKKLAKREIAIGISVIIAIVILICGIEFLKGINLFRPANFYMAYYDNVDGLEISAPVKINGYKVGQVREINFDYEKPGRTEVVLALSHNLHLPVDSKAVICSSLMGEAYIEITVGSSASLIPVGGEVATGQSAGLLSGISEGLMPKLNETLTYVDSLVINLNTVVADPALKGAITSLEDISQNVLLASSGLDNLMNKQMPGLMTNANGIITSTKSLVGNTNSMITNTNGIISRFGNVMSNVDGMSGNLLHFSDQLNELPLHETIDNVNATLANLEAFSEQLKNQNSTLGMLMNDPELYNRLNSVAASVDSLIVDIKRNPKRYISIKLL